MLIAYSIWQRLSNFVIFSAIMMYLQIQSNLGFPLEKFVSVAISTVKLLNQKLIGRKFLILSRL